MENKKDRSNLFCSQGGRIVVKKNELNVMEMLQVSWLLEKALTQVMVES